MRDTAPEFFAGSSTILSEDKSLAFILLQIDLLSLTNMIRKRLLEHFSLKPGKSTDLSRAMLFGEQSIAWLQSSRFSLQNQAEKYSKLLISL